MNWEICPSMIFAAGLGTRMKLLTEKMPKPLVKIAGRSFLERAIDHLLRSGVHQNRIVVNAFHFREQIEEFITNYPGIQCSTEDDRLETGGGAKKALPLLNHPYFFTVNGDAVWVTDDLLEPLKQAWNPDIMDALLLLTRCELMQGYEGDGDFFMDDSGRLTRRGEDDARAPFVYVGCQIIKADSLTNTPEVFSMNLVWDRMIAKGRLFGAMLDGRVFHISSLEDIQLMEPEIVRIEQSTSGERMAVGRGF